MDRVGTIIEANDDTAVVRMRRHISCEQCGRCGGILSSTDRKELVVEVANPIKAEVGHKVRIETDESQILFVTFMLYIVPIFTLVAGILLWLQLPPHFALGGSQEIAAIAAGFALMSLVFMGIRVWDRSAKASGKYSPVITELVNEEDFSEEEPSEEEHPGE